MKKWSLETLPILPNDWKLEFRPSAAKRFKAICAVVKQASIVVIATDADREGEGETIGREVLDPYRWHGPVQRLWLSALAGPSYRGASDASHRRPNRAGADRAQTSAAAIAV